LFFKYLQVGNFDPYTLDEVLEHMPKAKRKLYKRILLELLAGIGWDGKLNAFVKIERTVLELIKNLRKNLLTGVYEDHPEPRLVSPRSPHYNMMLARYLKVIEELILSVEGDGVFLPKGRIFAKGLNDKERAEQILNKWSERNAIEPYYWVKVDCSRFDMHVHKKMLEVEHKFYTHFFKPIHHSELNKILSYQLINKGRTRAGLKFTVPGSRASGDMNTALGNCVIMIGTLIAFFAKYKYPYQILDDGDDCLLMIPIRLFQTFATDLKQYFSSTCHDIKIEDYGDDINKVIFCQAHLMYTPTGPVMCRIMDRMMSRTLCGGANLRNKTEDYLTTIGLAIMIMNRGVPVFWHYGLFIFKLGVNSGGTFKQHLLEYKMKHIREGFNYSYLEPTHQGRLQYQTLFDLSTGEQEQLESDLANSTLTLADAQIAIAPDLLLKLRTSMSETFSVRSDKPQAKSCTEVLTQTSEQYARIKERKKGSKEGFQGNPSSDKIPGSNRKEG